MVLLDEETEIWILGYLVHTLDNVGECLLMLDALDQVSHHLQVQIICIAFPELSSPTFRLLLIGPIQTIHGQYLHVDS